MAAAAIERLLAEKLTVKDVVKLTVKDVVQPIGLDPATVRRLRQLGIDSDAMHDAGGTNAEGSRRRSGLMTTPPTVVTSRGRQHELLRDTHLGPDRLGRGCWAREAGWSGTITGIRRRGSGSWGRGEGLGVEEPWLNPVEVIPLSELEAIARAMPGKVREQLVEVLARWRQSQSASPRFAATAAAIGGGPIAAGVAVKG